MEEAEERDRPAPMRTLAFPRKARRRGHWNAPTLPKIGKDVALSGSNFRKTEVMDLATRHH